MGSLTCNAKTLCGDTVQVAFIADELSDGLLPDAIRINMQMDGDGGYSPLKKTTASVTFLADGAELMALCTADYTIRAVIKNTTKQKILFSGFIVPNSYNQGLTGYNDTITIECVDWLGFAKYVPYSQVDVEKGFSVMGLSSIAKRCFTLINGGAASVTVMIPATVLVSKGSDQEIFLEAVVVSESCFFTSALPDEVTKDYRPVAMNCEEVLTMISESLRLTWLSVGNRIFLADVLSLHYGDSVYTDITTGDVVTYPVLRTITEESIADTACNVSSLARVSMTEVKHARADEVQIMQDPFDTATLHKDGEYVEFYDAVEDPYNRVISVPLRSDIYNDYPPVDVNMPCYSQFVAWRNNKSVVPSPGSPHFLDNYAWGADSWDVALKMYDKNKVTPIRVLLRRKIKYTLPVVGIPRGLVKNAARVLCMSAEIVKGDRADLLWPHNSENIDCRLLVSVIVDGRYYSPVARDYVDEKTVFAVNIYKDGTAHWDIYILGDREEDGIPIPASGALEVVIYSSGELLNPGWDVAWLRRFNVVLKSDTYALRHDLLRPAVERVGFWDNNRTQSIAPPLDIYYNLTEKLLGANAAEPALLYYVAGEELPLAEYAHRLANVGDRKMYEMSLLDDGNIATPLDVFRCPLWSGYKSVAGYERDVLENKIILTLI